MRLLKSLLAVCALLLSVQVAEAQGPDLDLVKDDGGITVDPGNLILYTLTVSNIGSQDVSGVVLTETVPDNSTFDAGSSDSWICAGTTPGASCTLSLGSITAGAPTQTFIFAVEVDSPLPAGISEISNTASITDDGSSGPDSDPTNNVSTDSTPIAGTGPDLVVAKSDGDISATAGDSIAYTLSVLNVGSQVASGVVLTETVPENTTFDATSSDPWICAGTTPGATCTLNVGSITTGGPTQAFTFAVQVDSALPAGVTEITNAASVADDGANGPDLDPADNTSTDSTPIAGATAPDLVVVKSDGDISTEAGDIVAYALDVSNVGAQDASGVLLTETVPENSTFDAGSSSPSWICIGTTPGATCTLNVASIAAGAPTQSFVFAVQVDSPLPAGVNSITNTASITDDGSSGPDLDPADNTSTDSTPIAGTTAPDLVVTKNDGDVSAEAGDVVAYALDVSNVGTQDASGVLLTETIPENTTFDAGSSSPSWICIGTTPGATCTLNVGSIAAGAPTQSFVFAVQVDSPLPAGVNSITNTASIADDGSVGPDLDPSDNTSTDSTPIAGATAPDLVVVKSDGDVSAEAGDVVAYALDVSNVGTQDASGVLLTETVPENTTFDAGSSSPSWICIGTTPGATCTLNVGSIAAGAPTQSFVFAVQVDSPLPAGVNSITNTASVADDGASGPDLDPADNMSTDSTPIASATAPDLVVVKSDGDVSAEAGDIVAYVLDVSNVGTQDASGVVLTETVPENTTFDAGSSSPSWICIGTTPGATCTLNVGSIAAGAPTQSFAFAVEVDSPLPAGVNSITNTASVADDGASGPDLDPADNTSTDSTPIAGATAPDLVVVKSDGDVSAEAGDIVAYVLDVSNVGTQDASGVLLTEIVPENTTFDAGSSSPSWICIGTTPGATCTLNVGSIAAGAPTQTFIFAVEVDSPLPAGVNSITNTASITDDGSSGPDLDPTDNTSTDSTPIAGTTAPDLVVVKSDGDVSAEAGDIVAYALDVSNVGTQDASGVLLTETVPENSTFDVGSSDPSWICIGTTPGATCTLNVGSIAAGAPPQTFVFAVQVDSPLPAGVSSITNTASITDDGASGPDLDPTDNTSTDSTPIAGATAPDLVVLKSDGDSTAEAGDVVAYALEVSNAGTQDASDVLLTETVPENTTFDAGSSSPSWICIGTTPGATCTLNVGSIAAGAPTQSFIFAVEVNSPLPAGVNSITNTASITDDGSGGPDLDPADNTSTDSTPIAGTTAPDLVVTKSDGGISAEAGDVVAYALDVSNVGTQDASGVLLTETVPENSTFDAGSSSPSWICIGTTPGATCTLNVGSITAGAPTQSFVFAVQVDSPLPAGVNSITNTASVADDGSSGPDLDPADNTSTDSTPIAGATAPDLVVTKSDGDISAEAGDVIAYALDVSNAGTQDASGVLLTETVPENTTFDAGSSSPSWICIGTTPGATCTLNVGSIAAGAPTQSFVFAVQLDLPLPAGVTEITNAALVADDGASGPDLDPADNTSTDSTPIAGATAPDLVVTKSDGDISAESGDVIAYTLDVSNVGTQDASGVLLTEIVPENITFDAGSSSPTWICIGTTPGATCTLNVGSIAAGAPTQSFVFAVQVDSPLPAGVNSITNTASITDDGSSGPDLDPADNTSTDSTPIAVATAPDLVVTKSDGDISAAAGDVVAYALDVSNAGTQDASGVVLTETVPENTTFDAGSSDPWICTGTTPGASCTLNVGSIAAGAPTQTFIFAVQVDSPLPAGVTEITNAATVADDGASGPDLDPADNTSTDSTPIAGATAPDLVVVKSDGDISTEAGDVVAYALDVSNIGTQDASGVVLTEAVPENTTFDSGSSSPSWICIGTTPGATCTLNVDSIAAGAPTQSFVFAVQVDSPLPAGVSSITNAASITDDGSGGPDLDPTDNTSTDSTPIAGATAPDLVVVKSDGDSTAEAGDIVAYALDVSNVGTQDASGVVLTETVPENTTFDSGSSSPSWICMGTTPGATCTLDVGSIAAGAPTQTFVFAVQVDSPLPAGVTEITNAASVADDGASGPDLDPTNDTSTDSTPIASATAPDLVVTKSDGDISAEAGDIVAYALDVSNVGTQDASGVVLTETVPENTTFDSGSSSPSWICAGTSPGATCTLNVGSIAAGASTQTFVFAVQVDSPLPAGVNSITNTASITDDGSGGPDLDPADNMSTDSTPIAGATAPDLVVVKSDGDSTAEAGDVVAYVLDVSNVGTQDASGVLLTEIVPENTTFDAGSSSPSWICIGTTPGATCTLDVGSIAAGAPMQSFVFAVQVDSPLPAGVTEITNAASVADDGSSGPDLDPADNTSIDSTPVAGATAPDLVVVKSDGDISAEAGDIVTYALDVSNAGTQDASGVVLAETVPDNTTFDASSSGPWICAGTSPGATCTLNVGSIAAGAPTQSFVFAVEVDSPLPAGVNSITNTASVADDGASGPDLDPTDNTSIDSTLIASATAPDLVVVKSDGDVSAEAGDVVAYALEVSNAGTQDASDVVLTETVPENTTFDAGSSDPWICAGTTPGASCTLNLGPVLAGAPPQTVTFAVQVDSPLPAGVNSITNTASIADDGSSGPDLDPTDNTSTDSTPIAGATAPDLVVVKSDGDVSAEAGAVVAYALDVSNVGTQDASGVVLTETVPENTTFDAGSSDPSWICIGTTPGATCTLNVGSIAAGAPPAQTFVFAVQVASPLPAGVNSITNTVSIADDGASGPDLDPADNTSTDSTPIASATAPDLVVVKSDGDVSAEAGDIVAYVLDVSNVGTQDASGVLLTETVPENTTLDAGSSSPSWICVRTTPGATCTLNVGSIAAGAPTQSFVFAVQVDSPLPAGVNSITNTASIADDGASGPDLDPADNMSTDSTPIADATAPDLVVVKSDGDVSAEAGDVVTYALDVSNVGTRDASGVVLTETVPDNTTLDVDSSDPSWICIGTTPGATCRLNLGSIAASAPAKSFVFAVRVDSPLPAGVTEILNTASVADDGSSGPDLDPADNMSTDSTPIADAITPDLVVVKSDGDITAESGDVIAYSLTVRNTGLQDASGVILSETVPAHTRLATSPDGDAWICEGTTPGSTCALSVGLVAAGAPALTFVFEVEVDSPLPADVTSIVNVATIADDGSGGPDLDPSDNTSSDSTPISGTNAPDLVITKSDGDVSVGAGDVVVYDLSVSNIGSRDATGVVISESVPANTNFDGGSSDLAWICNGTLPGSTCKMTVGVLGAGEAFLNFAFAVKVNSPLPVGVESIANTASVSDDGSNGVDLDPTNNTAAEVTPVMPPGNSAPDVVALKIDELLDPGSYDREGALVIEYTVLLENRGDQTALELVYTPEPDPHTRYLPGTATAPGGEILPLDEPPFFRARFDQVAPGEAPSIHFAVALDLTDARVLDYVECQGRVSGANFPELLTDDPDTPELFDPTRTEISVSEPPVAIPTLSPIGVVVLSAFLILAVMRRFRNGPAIRFE